MAVMLAREEARLEWERGTPLGRLVVPEVWRNRATSEGRGGEDGRGGEEAEEAVGRGEEDGSRERTTPFCWDEQWTGRGGQGGGDRWLSKME